MANTIYIDFRGQVIKLPVNPEEMWVKYSGNNETVEMIQNGEINIAKDKKLATIEITSFFPEDINAPYVVNGADDPVSYVELLKEIQDAKKPLRFIVSGTDVNQEMLIEAFEYGYAGGTNDIEYRLALKEYKPVTHKTVKLTQEVSKPAVKAAPPRPEPARKEVTIGCSVKVNGQLHRDSYGGGPGKTLSNYGGLVNFINLSGPKPYHVTDANGGWLGWVSADSVVVL